MNRYAPLLVVLCAAGASAQFVVRGSALPAIAPVTPVVTPHLSAQSLTLLTPALPTAALPAVPVLAAPVLPAAKAAAALAAAKAAPAVVAAAAIAAPDVAGAQPFAAGAQPLAAAAQPLAAAAKALEAVHGAAPSAAPILNRLFDAGVQAGGDAVSVGRSVQSPRAALSRPSSSRPALNAVRPSAEPAPPAPAWKRVALAVGRGAGFLASLWVGMQAADVAYSLAFAKLGLAGALIVPAALVAGAWFLRRTERSLGSRLFWAGALASASFSGVGQLLWDLTGSAAVGLPLGIAFGVFLALASAGVILKKRVNPK